MEENPEIVSKGYLSPQAEALLYCALIGYIYYGALREEQGSVTLIEFVNATEIREDDEELQNPVDLMLGDLKKRKPDRSVIRQYVKFKLAVGKTLKSILVSASTRFAPFDVREVHEITMYDELGLDILGDEKIALFLMILDMDGSSNFLISMIYTRLLNLLCERAGDMYGGRLPVHVKYLIGEAVNIGQIPNLEKLVVTIRSREISTCLVLQVRSQLKATYKDNADMVIGNMDNQVLPDDSGPTMLKELSEALGKETTDTFSTSDAWGNSPGYGTNYQGLGRELMGWDELAILDNGKCVLQLRGVRPFLSERYDSAQHPNYRLTADYNKRLALDMERFLDTRVKLYPKDEFFVTKATE